MDGNEADTPDEMLAAHLDRLELILSQMDAETRRLRTELDLRQLYVNELHAILNQQTRHLEDLDNRIRRLEPPPSERPRRPMPPTGLPITASIRIKKAF